jgi:hypothetical protein
MNTETEWGQIVEVGRGQVRGNFQLLRHNVYSLLDNILSEQIVTGDTMSVGMKLGRIKDAIIANGVVSKKNKKGKLYKPLEVSHPSINNGEWKEFKLVVGEPLYDAPRIKDDPEFMGRLGDKVAVAIIDGNPGLEAKYGDSLFSMIRRMAEGKMGQDNVEEDGEEDESDPTEFFEPEIEDADVIEDKGRSDPTALAPAIPEQEDTPQEEGTSTDGPMSGTEQRQAPQTIQR